MPRRALMRAAITAVTICVFGSPILHAESKTEIYGDLLAKYVAPGPNGINLVGYARWKHSKTDLDRLAGYLSALQSAKPSAMPRNEAFSYWINLYNAATLKVVLDHYPVESIRDIHSEGTEFFDFKAFAGPWRTKLIKVEGKPLSLDDIEQTILRPKFRDPRIHYALNCASLGCPNLKLTPWTAETLDADLNAAASAYINHPRGVRIGQDGSIRVSSIYNWYQEDFGGAQKGVLSHLRKYARPALAKQLRGAKAIAGHDYDWALNDARRRAHRG
jgi:hypothetical protein